MSLPRQLEIADFPLSERILSTLNTVASPGVQSDLLSRKRELREAIWREMEKHRIARFPLPCAGRIPNFVGAEQAATKLRELEIYKESSVVLVCPDLAQAPVRRGVLLDCKTLVMPTPRLRKGYVVVQLADARSKEVEASTIKGAFRYGRISEAMPRVELVVEGCVAVDREGNRLGKGGGYGDAEIRTARNLDGNVKVVTTCHSIQVVGSVPAGQGDEKVDCIVTERDVIETLGKKAR